ncbi:DUF3850 domain-containing protein [Cronobacter sakazakii]|uniref:DUF3850 domain-containing protein n=1 Tax=Cronobacter sakazakii TaxID=28141 RepID=UPI002A186E9E|nr:DUF3850 domain-containing protein [Cronobacter sakazakii]
MSEIRKPVTHNLKIWPEHYSAVCAGVKRAELRKNDRDYRAGDTLDLCEWDRDDESFTGEFISVTVTHVADVSDWMPGYVLLSIELALRERAETVGVPDLHKVVYHFRDLNEGFPVERFKADYVIAWMLANYPPAPVVPDDVLAALRNVAKIRLDFNDFDGDRRGMADCLGEAEEALIEVVNRRAAMLAAPDKEG